MEEHLFLCFDLTRWLSSQIKCNAFTLSDQRGLQAVGVGLFPNLCMVNHDCWPNCTVILNHGKYVGQANHTSISSTLND